MQKLTNWGRPGKSGTIRTPPSSRESAMFRTSRSPRCCHLIHFGPLAGVLALTLVATAPAQTTSVRRTSPSITLDTGARQGTCDVLRFTPDGRELLAVGDDKVVQVFGVADGTLGTRALRTLRWPIFRDARGRIYAADLGRDLD